MKVLFSLGFCVVSLVVISGCSQGPKNTAPPVIGRIGKPGSPPPTKTMSVAQYGAFAYASEENYCHTARWVISGTLLPQYASDPHPVAIKRGTKAQFIQRFHTDCTANGGVDLQDVDLIHVRVLDGKYAGEDRYLLPSDWYTQDDYSRYAKEQKEQQKLAAQQKTQLAATYAAIEKSGSGCSAPAKDSDAAGAADWKGDYQSGYDLATKGLAENKSCEDSAQRLMNSGFLISWKAWAERHLGMRSQAESDLDEADSLLQQCTDSGADKNSDLNCDVERGSNEGMMTVWKTEDSDE